MALWSDLNLFKKCVREDLSKIRNFTCFRATFIRPPMMRFNMENFRKIIKQNGACETGMNAAIFLIECNSEARWIVNDVFGHVIITKEYVNCFSHNCLIAAQILANTN